MSARAYTEETTRKQPVSVKPGMFSSRDFH